VRPIERRDGKQVEDHEDHVHEDPHHGHALQDGHGLGERADRLPEHAGDDHERNAGEHDEQIGRHARERDDDVASLEVAKVARIDRDRLGASDDRGAGDGQHDREDDGHERVDVLDRIPREAPERPRRGVALSQGGPSVRVFVRDHGEEQHGRDQDELLLPGQRGTGRKMGGPATTMVRRPNVSNTCEQATVEIYR
jgi:hypothetical protein